MNATEDPRVSDFRHRRREARERPRPRPRFRRHSKWRVVAKLRGEDSCCRTAHSRMPGWVLRMSRGAAREEVEPGYPGRVRIGARVAIGITTPNRSDRPPEHVAVLAVPAGDPSIGHADV